MALRKRSGARVSDPKPKLKKPVPFSFVLDELDGVYTLVRPMFGAHAVYRDEKILLILRQKDANPKDNGVWVVSPVDQVESIKREIPALREIFMFETSGPTTWHNLPEEAPTFEEDVLRVCALIRAGDPRIGKAPKEKKPKRPKGAAAKGASTPARSGSRAARKAAGRKNSPPSRRGKAPAKRLRKER